MRKDEKDKKGIVGNEKDAILKELEGILIGKSANMTLVREKIYEASLKDCNVMILGDTGTGKEIVANQIHELWAKRTGCKKPMVIVSCPDIYEEQWEAELFGIGEKDAPGVKKRDGLLKEADGTTLFLDEVGDIPPKFQPKLLRAVQFKKFHRMGGKEVYSNFRLISATNRNFEDGSLSTPAFRKDLFYRLNELTINVLPIRERKEDILPIFLHFLEKYHPGFPKKEYKLWLYHLYYLIMNKWTGNVRELENWVKATTPNNESHIPPVSTIFFEKGDTVVDFVIKDCSEYDLTNHSSGWGFEVIDLIQLSKDWLKSEEGYLWHRYFDIETKLIQLAKKYESLPEYKEDVEELREVMKKEKQERERIIQRNMMQLEGEKSETQKQIQPEPSKSSLALEQLADLPTSLDKIERLYLTEVMKQHPVRKRARGSSIESLAKKLDITSGTLKKKIAELKGKPQE